MTNESVLVFGASRGIGRAVASRFHDAGFGVTGAQRSLDVPEGVVAVKADITNADDITHAFDIATNAHGPVSRLVVATAITRDRLLLRMSPDELREVMETNAIGPMLAAKTALRPMMKQKRGSIILMSSTSVRFGVAGQTNYTASKGAIEAFVKSLAREVAGAGITVNVVVPGPTDTDMMAAVPEAEREAMISMVPMKRLGTPEEVADVVYDVSGYTYMTGSIVTVAGGLN